MDSLSVNSLVILYTYIWIHHLYRIEPSLGKIEFLVANSCKHIKEVLATDCTNLPSSGVYWVWKENPMQVYTHVHTLQIILVDK